MTSDTKHKLTVIGSALVLMWAIGMTATILALLIIKNLYAA